MWTKFERLGAVQGAQSQRRRLIDLIQAFLLVIFRLLGWIQMVPERRIVSCFGTRSENRLFPSLELYAVLGFSVPGLMAGADNIRSLNTRWG